MGGHTLESSKEKDLGVLIEDNLKPSAQCAKAASKANMVLGQLTRGCTGRDPDNLPGVCKTPLGICPGQLVSMDPSRYSDIGASPAQVHQASVRDG